MMQAFMCIKRADYITTRDNCASCEIDCENVEKAISERAKICSVLSNYSLADIRSDNPPVDVQRLIKDIRVNI